MLRDFVARHAQSDGAVITYQGLESCFVDLAGVVTGHFNAIAGLDHLRDVCFLAVIGRPLPRPEDVRCMAAALTGRAIPHENTHTEVRGVLLEDGTGLGLPCRIFADPDLEAIRAAVTDAEVLQAVGRARGARRTADNPVTILLLADVVLPVPVATVTRWADVRPDLVERMAVRGVVLTSPGDLVICYPDLCGGSADAAEKALKRDGKIDDLGDIPLRITLHRGMSGKYPFFPLRYRPVGRGQQMREAWFRPTIVPNPRAWLEEQLGPLAFFKMANTSDGGTAMMGSQVQTSDISSVTDDKSTIDEGLDPSAVYPPIMLFAPPVGFWRAANEIQIEEAAIARIKLDTKNRYQSDPLISILTYRDKQMNRVNIEWSVPECRMVSKDIPQRDHQVGPPELIVLVHGAGRDV